MSDNGGKEWKSISFHRSFESSRLSSLELPANSTGKLLLLTSSYQVISCDFVVSATGVVPNTELFRGSPVRLDEEGYIEVDDYFQSSVPNVFAAGDCCSYLPKFRSTEFFFQMKLWTQARIMGMFVAQCMSGVAEDYGLDTHLELFTHITRFFGYRVVLLGRYNAQGYGEAIEKTVKQSFVRVTGEEVEFHVLEDSSDDDPQSKRTRREGDEDLGLGLSPGAGGGIEVWVRVHPLKEYVKLVLKDGRLIGCLLIGDTDLEEVFENLILNRLNLSQIGMKLLDPTLDIADYFD